MTRVLTAASSLPITSASEPSPNTLPAEGVAAIVR
jgi:hypothetical protein